LASRIQLAVIADCLPERACIGAANAGVKGKAAEGASLRTGGITNPWAVAGRGRRQSCRFGPGNLTRPVFGAGRNSGTHRAQRNPVVLAGGTPARVTVGREGLPDDSRSAGGPAIVRRDPSRDQRKATPIMEWRQSAIVEKRLLVPWPVSARRNAQQPLQKEDDALGPGGAGRFASPREIRRRRGVSLDQDALGRRRAGCARASAPAVEDFGRQACPSRRDSGLADQKATVLPLRWRVAAPIPGQGRLRQLDRRDGASNLAETNARPQADCLLL